MPYVRFLIMGNSCPHFSTNTVAPRPCERISSIQHVAVEGICRVLQDRIDICNNKPRVRLHNLCMGHAMGEQPQDMVYTEARALHYGFPAKNLRVGNDTTHDVHLHNTPMQCSEALPLLLTQFLDDSLNPLRHIPPGR